MSLTADWRTDDPRVAFIDRTGSIVVINHDGLAAVAWVSAHDPEQWHVSNMPAGHPGTLGPEDEWPGYRWIGAPE